MRQYGGTICQYEQPIKINGKIEVCCIHKNSLSNTHIVIFVFPTSTVSSIAFLLWHFFPPGSCIFFSMFVYHSSQKRAESTLLQGFRYSTCTAVTGHNNMPRGSGPEQNCLFRRWAKQRAEILPARCPPSHWFSLLYFILYLCKSVLQMDFRNIQLFYADITFSCLKP